MQELDTGSRSHQLMLSLNYSRSSIISKEFSDLLLTHVQLQQILIILGSQQHSQLIVDHAPPCHPAINLHITVSVEQRMTVAQCILKQRNCKHSKLNSQFIEKMYPNYGIINHGNPKAKRAVRKMISKSVISTSTYNSVFLFANISFESIAKWRAAPQWPPQKISTINQIILTVQPNSPKSQDSITELPSYQS